MATIKDVAEMAGVSLMTVSRVLNQKGYVSEEKKKIVLECAEKLNYRPNMLARSLVLNRTNTIGILLSYIENPVYAQYVTSISDVLRPKGISIILSCANLLEDWEKGFYTLLDKQVDGLIVLPTQVHSNPTDAERQAVIERVQKALKNANKPCVCVGDAWILTQPDVRVEHDYGASLEMAIQHLLDMGHTKIGCCRFDDTGKGLWKLRYEVYCEMMKKAGLPVREEWIAQCNDDYIDIAMRATQKMLDEATEYPTAICCINDVFAVGVMQALRSRGLRVPEDVSVIGNDGSVFSLCTAPKLTTVSIQPYELGQRVATRLLHMLNDPASEAGTEYIAPVFREGGTVRRIQTGR